MTARAAKAVLGLLLCAGAAGCRHKTAALVIPPPSPVAVANAPLTPNAAQLPTEPTQPVPLPSVTVPARPAPRKARKKVVPAAPVQVASAVVPPPPGEMIGSLTEGNQSAQSRQKVVDLLAANDKRLAGMSAQLKDRQRDQVVRVQNFQVEAQKALGGGDSDGAMMLATKAKVLLDELFK